MKHDSCGHEVWLDIFISGDPGHNPGGGCTPKMVQQLQNYKVRQSIRGKGGHLYLQINMKNTNLDFKYILNLCQVSLKFIHWLHRSKSCVQIGNKCDNLCWNLILENSKWFQSLNLAWLHMYIYNKVTQLHAQSRLWPFKKTIIKTWAYNFNKFINISFILTPLSHQTIQYPLATTMEGQYM